MFVRIGNTPRDYAWGSTTAIAGLLGTTPSGHPEAELWLGAHAGSPSVILDPAQADGARDLASWIERDPQEALGGAATRLPYLLKVLAAAGPLSLQAHPSNAQAAAGFARENAAGIPLDSPDRNYKDASHKPE
ncbi:type I phosphomannose isomerase catalytic subunit, partial [Kitasatospora herbaricolor]|uniref:type I phosphomannose isomerase catalytic subunit n=1 Tax=Kitasatospora herbaricolor TaxID=68217 RepID=UPI0036D8DD62